MKSGHPDEAAMRDNAEKALGGSNLPVVAGRNEQRVRRDFWAKLKRYLARIPFAEDLLAAHYCAMDAKTPRRVKAILFAALAYFIVPADLIPDIFAGVGFTDDMTVLMLAIASVRANITPEHRAAAQSKLAEMKAGKTG